MATLGGADQDDPAVVWFGAAIVEYFTTVVAAKALEYESQRQVREDVARLEASRNELATDVESMARHLESERNRLREALSEILSWVDENVQPTNSLMGVRPKPASSAKPAAPAAIARAM